MRPKDRSREKERERDRKCGREKDEKREVSGEKIQIEKQDRKVTRDQRRKKCVEDKDGQLMGNKKKKKSILQLCMQFTWLEKGMGLLCEQITIYVVNLLIS